VSDNDNSLVTTFDKFVESNLDLVFAFSIQSACGFIKEEQFGSADQSSGDRNPLLLSTGKFNSPFTDHGVITFGEGLLIVYKIVSV